MKLENACDRIYLGVCDEMNVFFDAFINQLPKIHRRALRKKKEIYCVFGKLVTSSMRKTFGQSTLYSCRTNVFI